MTKQGHIIQVQVLKTYDFQPRERRVCSVCEKRRLTTRQMWKIGDNYFFASVCNSCLTATPPWPKMQERPS